MFFKPPILRPKKEDYTPRLDENRFDDKHVFLSVNPSLVDTLSWAVYQLKRVKKEDRKECRYDWDKCFKDLEEFHDVCQDMCSQHTNATKLIRDFRRFLEYQNIRDFTDKDIFCFLNGLNPKDYE